MIYNFLMLLDKILPKPLNPFSGLKELGKLGQLKEYLKEAKIAVIILGAALVGILISLVILIIKKVKK